MRQKCPNLTSIVLHDRKVLTSQEDCIEMTKDNYYIPPKSAPEFKDPNYVADPDSVGEQWSLERYESLMHKREREINYFLHCDQVKKLQ